MQFTVFLTPYTFLLGGLSLIAAILLYLYIQSWMKKKRFKDLNNKVKVYNESIEAHGGGGVLILSDENDVLFANQEFADYFGIKDTEVTKSFLSEIQLTSIPNPSESIGFLDAVNQRTYIDDVQMPKMQQPAPMKISINHFQNPGDKRVSWRVIVMHDLSEYYRLQKQFQKTQSYNDLLTDLPIQGQLVSDLLDANLRSNIQGTSIILAFFGIKHFAMQQTTLGYTRTNTMIQHTANVLKEMMKNDEKLYYRGRGDFAILIADSHNPDGDILAIKERIGSLHGALLVKGIDADFSQAIMHLKQDKRSPDALIDRCYEMQLESEWSNKSLLEETDDAHVYKSNIAQTASNNQAGNGGLTKQMHFTRTDFANAIQRKEFFSFYQPIFELESDRLIGAEYLMRWNHPKFGLLSASKFLDKAVALNMLTEITDYLLENVFSHKSSWDIFGVDDFNLSINFALPELRVANFAEKLERKLNEHAIDAETVTIDISEKLLSEDIGALQEEVAILKKLGVQIALDSFGEGFTHLRLLEELPFDTIKIDRSLIQGIEINPDKRKLVSAIIAMGKVLGVTVGATHIDSDSVRKTLTRLGCDYGQGYYFSKAIPFFEMFNFIQAYRERGFDPTQVKIE